MIKLYFLEQKSTNFLLENYYIIQQQKIKKKKKWRDFFKWKWAKEKRANRTLSHLNMLKVKASKSQ